MAAVRPKINPRHFITTNAVEIASLQTLVKQFLDSECETEQTRRAYTGDLKKLLDFASYQCVTPKSQLHFAHLDRALLSDFRDERLETEKPATVQRRVAAIKAFCGFIAGRHRIDNPAERLAGVHVPDSGFLGLRDEDYQKFRAKARAQLEPVHRFAPLLAFGTGLRCAELCALRMRNVSPALDWIIDLPGKGGKVRAIPITEEMRGEFQIYLFWREQFPADRDSPFVVAPKSAALGQQMGTKTFWRIVNRIGEECGFRVHPHMARHTFAYRYLDNYSAGDIRALQRLARILGHSSIQTTLRYLGIEDREVWESMKDMRL